VLKVIGIVLLGLIVLLVVAVAGGARAAGELVFEW